MRCWWPEYGSNKRIQVKLVDGDIAITNLHIGSLGDIIAYPIDVDPDLNISKVQLLDAILHELSSNGFSDSEASDFWSDFDNLQKAKIVRWPTLILYGAHKMRLGRW